MSLEYNIEITGACSGLGAVLITPTSGYPPYTFSYQEGLGTDYEVLNSYRGSLIGGSYSVLVSDSSFPTNNEQIININISTGVQVSITDLSGSTCGENNGFVFLQSETSSNEVTFNLYDVNDNLLRSDIAFSNVYYYDTLSGGIYNVIVNDNGGCTAQTGNFVIPSGTPLDFGFYVVNDGPCNGTREVYVSGGTGVTINEEIHTGKLFITGLTGNGPFTYQWSENVNGQTGTSVTGLSEDVYSCTITSADGCVVTKAANVGIFDPLGFGSWVVTQPTCFNSDGTATLTITGGTGPFYYLASNGVIDVTYNTSVTFTGLPAGDFFVEVTDASLCKNTFSVALNTPGTFVVAQILIENSSCSSTDGRITINLRGGSPAYTYTLVKPDTNTEIVTTNSSTQVFTNLESGDYTLIINDNASCVYQQEITIFTQDKFTINLNPTNGLCGLPQGSLTAEVSGEVEYPVNYILSNGYSYLGSFSSGVTFNNLDAGDYTLQVTDFSGCRVENNFVITTGENLDFTLYPTQCGTGNDGAVTVYITQGVPPFSISWSSNVGTQTGTTVTGLTAGIYTLTVVDDNGCNLTKSIEVTCPQYINSYRKYKLFSNNFEYQLGSQRNLTKIANEGFEDSIVGNVGCVLNNMVFTVSVVIEDYDQIVSGTIVSTPYEYYDYCQNFYSGNTIPSATTVCFNQFLPYSGITNSTTECYNFQNSFYTGYTRTDVPTAQF
jgi:hypothetical protein